MDVDLDHAGIGGDGDRVEARVARRGIALDDDGKAGLDRRLLDRGDEIEIILERRHGRHEDIEVAAARLDAERRAHDPFGRAPRLELFLAQRRHRGLALARLGAALMLGRLRALARRQRRPLREGVRLDHVRIVLGRHPRQRGERQPVAERTVARREEDALAAQRPIARKPDRPAILMTAVDGKGEADGLVEPALEHAREPRALLRVLELAVERIDIDGKLALAPDILPWILESGANRLGIDGEAPGERRDEALRLCRPEAVIDILAREQLAVRPDGIAVAPPEGGEGPARQALARIPFALAEMKQPAGGEAAQQPVDEIGREAALGRPECRHVPLVSVHVVDRDEGRLAAHGETHVARRELAIDDMAERLDRGPLRCRIGLGGARRLGDARHLHDMVERHLARLDRAADGCGTRRIGRAGERDMALARKQPRGGIEPDPARARQIDLGPGVEIGEVA